jgi:hypothetical protein
LLLEQILFMQLLTVAVVAVVLALTEVVVLQARAKV